FVPSNEQTKDDYTNLLFESRKQINNNQSQLIIDEEDSDIYKKYNDPHFKNYCLIELPINTKGLYNLVKATSYLSLQEYWDKFCTEEEYHQFLAEKIPKNYRFAKLSSILASNSAITNNLVLDLYNNEDLDNAYKRIRTIIIFTNLFKKENVIH
ncbi:6048_t:CDS:2, partial [Gigaspora margarita]